MKKQLLTAAGALAIALSASATVDNILPVPKSVAPASGTLSFNGAVALPAGTGSALTEAFEAAGFTTGSGTKVTINKGAVEGAYDYVLAEYPAEAYRLEVTLSGITITAPENIGVIRAAQTLAQLAQDGNGSVECVTITDWPAFKLRGWMQDTGRSFLSVDELKRQIDLLARFKVNTFHWHLTDFTGWRLAIDAYPQLTGKEAEPVTRYPGKYYTKEQAREIQDYAAARGVTVIPEIDMPGHAHVFEHVMGHNMQSEQGKKEVKVILDEVCALFDKSPYIHIGGDEVSFPDAYIVEMINYVHSKGKKAVIWNRYNTPAKSVDPKAIPCDLTTNWATSGTLSPGVPNIDMRYNYTNHFDVFADLVGIYKSTIFDSPQGNADIAGTISAAWNDTKTATEDDIMRQNNQYAAIIASASRAWKGGGKQYIERGGTVLPLAGDEYDDFADWERRFLHHKNTTLAAAAHQIPYVKQTNVRWRVTDQIPNGGNPSTILAPENHRNDELMPTSFDINGSTYGSQVMAGAGIYLRHIWHGTVKGNYDNPLNGMTAYAWTYVYSPEEQDAGALVETYTYSRSGNEKGPDRGKWDRRGSRLWVNGSEIAAPEWTQPGKNITQNHLTEGLANENFTARKPVQLRLKKGWNSVFFKLPHANNGGTSRDKWQFTFVLTDPEGRNALEGLVYSPSKALDAAAEELGFRIDQYVTDRNSRVADGIPGFLPASLAEEFDAVVAEIRPTLSQTLTAAERQAQTERLNKAYDAFVKACETASPSYAPAAGQAYYLSTPLRFNRFVTGKGAGNELIGETATSAASAWKFESRADGSYDIVNAADGTYISPASTFNTALRAVAEAPAAGWQIKPAATKGYCIIVSGEAQFNQTNNASLGFKVYNWGNGNNTDDTGCQYLFAKADSGEAPEDPDTPEAEGLILTLLDVALDGNHPVMLPDAEAKAILGAEAVTVAIDYTQTAAPVDFRAIVASSDTTATARDSYFALATRGSTGKPAIRSWFGGKEDQFTLDPAGMASGRHTIVVAMNPSEHYRFISDGSTSGEVNANSTTFGMAKGANAVTLGGVVLGSNANEYPFTGTIHSIRFYNRALSAEEMSALRWTGLTPSAIDIIEAPGALPGRQGIYDLSGRRLTRITTPGLYIIDGRKTLVK